TRGEAMKYAFTTLACPAWSIEQVVEAATTLGYDGVELRLLDGAVIDPGADRAKVEQAVARCRAAGVEVCALDSSCTFNHADPGARQREISDLLRWIDLAEDLRVPLVLLGEGEVPVREQLQALDRHGYTGYVSVEWEKKW